MFTKLYILGLLVYLYSGYVIIYPFKKIGTSNNNQNIEFVQDLKKSYMKTIISNMYFQIYK